MAEPQQLPLVFDYEAAYADANDDLDAVVYLAAG